jgi:fatty acid desaturase
MHDASHFSVTHNPLVWKYLGAGHDFFNGASYLVWLYQHMLGHHPYTNIDGADPDIVTSEKDVRRIKESQPWYSFYINQVCCSRECPG